MPRYAARVDSCHPEIVNGLRKAGASVRSLASMGRGWPDLLVGFKGMNYLFELKTPGSDHSKRKPGLKGHGSETKAAQLEWYRTWLGRVDVVETLQQALHIITGSGKAITVVMF